MRYIHLYMYTTTYVSSALYKVQHNSAARYEVPVPSYIISAFNVVLYCMYTGSKLL